MNDCRRFTASIVLVHASEIHAMSMCVHFTIKAVGLAQGYLKTAIVS